MNRHEKRLGKVITALKNAELNRLGALARERARLEDEIGALRDQRKRLWEGPPDSLLAQARTRQARERWINAKETEIGQELARLAARMENQKKLAKTAIGRAESFSRLIEKARARRGG